jgi:hypothetical protein
MLHFFEQLVISIWNRWHRRRDKKREHGGTSLGHQLTEGQATKRTVTLSQVRRTTHVAVLGKTGSGKSYFLRNLAQQDIDHGYPFALFDQHGDLLPPTLSYLAESGVDPADVILINPANREWAVGLNPLETTDDQSRFLLAAEITRNIADRWDFKGARTEELLRNGLFVLSANGLTFLEMSLLLVDGGYRAQLLKKVANADVREYFTLRYDPLSEPMKATMREPVLNKLSEFVGDPHFRHILGQRESTISIDDALDTGKTILVNVSKGSLGVHAATFGSLVLAKLKAAIFRRQQRKLYSVFVDEVQNLVAADTDFDVLFSEARKFGAGIVTANQFLAQLPPKMRSAMQAVGTRVFFQLSPEDANQVAQEIDGGRSMAERLRNLPPRHFVVKSGNQCPQEAVTPEVSTSKFSARGFVELSNQLHAKLREEVERDIQSRRPQVVREVLHDWE